MRKVLCCLITLATITIGAFAENKVFIREYNYQAGENDSKITARAKALTEVKRLLLEELGVYMESYTNYIVEDQKGTITKDFFQNEIKSLSAGITETKILEENWNGIQYYIKAEIEVDPTDVARKINASLEKRQADVVIDSLRILLSNTQTLSLQKNEEVKALQSKYETQIAQVQQQKQKVDELKKQLQTLKTQLDTYQKQEQEILSEVQQIEQRIKKATDIVLQNARLGMTYTELCRVCGKPRSIKFAYVNYGKIWIKMSNFVDTHPNSVIVKGAYVTDPYEVDFSSTKNIIKE
ncbi:MAG: hypothetical protein KBB61_03155 [Paludibacteraceae bacterium]|jgi:DNA repair exonuclease SbcCD ATPase subunit|nr:hypothetical protein [Paludibacteraceae bacterium]MDI9537573.1 hypothetical protein [Bacteroidota bacterium]HHT61104.1 hypothetical protein [Bacteroidales bacterium]MBP9039684.1 hypothetical protein [Paludibacteraceae bacterium]HOA46332.1 hypothetical protein [Paludibacteraceae bacterium]